jgi:hypothetical protein
MTLATFTISPAGEVELVEDYQSGTIRYMNAVAESLNTVLTLGLVDLLRSSVP